MGRLETKQYWIEQLAEYWDSGLTIPEYCEIKELSYESTRRWIAALKKEREEDGGNKETLPMVEIEIQPAADKPKCFSGVKLLLNGVEVRLDCGFDSETLHTALTVLRA